MLYRSITERIEQFFEKEKKAALMVTGARQVGKTYCIREYAKQHFKYVIEINFLEMPQAVALFENATGSDDILMRISAFDRHSHGKRPDNDSFLMKSRNAGKS